MIIFPVEKGLNLEWMFGVLQPCAVAPQKRKPKVHQLGKDKPTIQAAPPTDIKFEHDMVIENTIQTTPTTTLKNIFHED